MQVELIYLAIAYSASVVILYKFAWPLIKSLLLGRKVEIETELEMLSAELEKTLKLYNIRVNNLKQMEQKVALLENTIPKILQEQRDSLEAKHMDKLAQCRQWCQQKFIDEVKHNNMLDLKAAAVSKIIDAMSVELRKHTNTFDTSIDNILNAYKKHTNEAKVDAR